MKADFIVFVLFVATLLPIVGGALRGLYSMEAHYDQIHAQRLAADADFQAWRARNPKE